MGACQCQRKKRPRQENYQFDFIADKHTPLQGGSHNTQIWKPRFSKLYNILRKSNDVEVIHSSKQQPLFKNSTNPNMAQMSKNSLKTVYNFKNIVIIGEAQPYVKYLSQINPKEIYTVPYSEAQQFLQQFPNFAWQQKSHIPAKEQIVQQIKKTPLLLFLKSQLFKPSRIQIEKIFLHNIEYSNPKIYQELHINYTINIQQNLTSTQKRSYYLNQLKKSKGTVLVMHNKNTIQQQLVSLFTDFFVDTYKISEQSSTEYIGENLGRRLTSSSKNVNLPQNLKVNTTQQTDNIANLLKNIEKQSGSIKKVQQVYNVFLLALSNICNNPENQNYRKIKVSNSRMNEAAKYKHSIQLLQELGWKKQNQYWTNTVDIKYLKVLRIDLEVAYTRYLAMDKK